MRISPVRDLPGPQEQGGEEVRRISYPRLVLRARERLEHRDIHIWNMERKLAMALSPLEAFENAIDRATHLIDLYNLLHNRRQRSVRSDWARKFKEMMRWPQSADICRIDGEDAVLVIKDGTNWNLSDFQHEYLGEMLRAALILSVSAFDRFNHDLVVKNVLGILRKPKTAWPKALADFPVPLSAAEEAIEWSIKQRRPPNPTQSRPRVKLKTRFRECLHEKTFQGFGQVGNALSMLGIADPWSKISSTLGEPTTEIEKRLNSIVHRRNQIAHEGDVEQASRPREVKLNPISAPDVREDLEWLGKLGEAISEVVDNEV